MSSTKLKEWLYPVEPLEPQSPSEPMQVLALGLPRMGTDSLRRALQILGYRVYHGFDVMEGGPSVQKAWALLGRRKWGIVDNPRVPVTGHDLDHIIGHCDAVSDQPCVSFALELIEAHPDAKIILNYREEVSWCKSIEATFLPLYESWRFQYISFFDPALYWRKQWLVMANDGLFQGSTRLHARRVHKEYRAVIKGSVAPDRLLEWQVADGWKPLCAFLGKPIPDEEFPRGNTPSQLIEASIRASDVAFQRAYRRVWYAAALILVLIIWPLRTIMRFLEHKGTMDHSYSTTG